MDGRPSIVRRLTATVLRAASYRGSKCLQLLREGLAGATRTRETLEINGEFLAIDTALGRLEAGDLCLILIDQVEEALAHIAGRIAAV